MRAAATAPLVVVGLAFTGYCLVDIARANRTRYLPRWAWSLLAMLAVPLGGAVYLLLGRDPS